jgi:hypothetical protein
MVLVALAAVMLCSAGQAQAAGPDSSQIDTGQIVAARRAADVSAGQIIQPSQASAISASQLTRSLPRADAPAPLSTPAQGRNTSITAVKGHDRCDPAWTAGASKADCARIIDNRAGEFAPSAPDQSEPIVHPAGTSSGLVDDILNGGTGSIVVLPGK